MRILAPLHERREFTECGIGLGQVRRCPERPSEQFALRRVGEYPFEHGQIQLGALVPMRGQFAAEIAVLPDEFIRIDMKQPVGPGGIPGRIRVDRLAAHLRGGSALLAPMHRPTGVIAAGHVTSRNRLQPARDRVLRIVQIDVDSRGPCGKMPAHIAENQRRWLVRRHHDTPGLGVVRAGFRGLRRGHLIPF